MAVEVEQHNRAIAQLADQLTEGFNALSGEYRILLDKHKQLEEQLEWAKRQHLTILQRLDSETSDTDHRTYLNDLETAGLEASGGDVEWLESLSTHKTSNRRSNAYLIMQAGLACEKLKKYAAINSVNGVKIWNGTSADPKTKTEPVDEMNPIKANQDTLSPMEKDFTVAGTPSRLGCPFSRTNSMRQPKSILKSARSTTTAGTGKRSSAQSKRSSFHDPIQAEICGADLNGPPEIAVEEAQQAVCPIRFLDQHKPEEVAEYFEKHKHELPRSHEICVKRFQSNAEQIRQLDNKYGNLVNMIQGLGQKHQPLLPAQLAEEEEQMEAREVEDKITKWAKTVSTSLQNGQGGVHADMDGIESKELIEEDRQSHFDRPLREIRVGESPSRPWGVNIPVKYMNNGSDISLHSQPTASPPPRAEPAEPTETPALTPKKCPFDHTKLSRPRPHPPMQPEIEEKRDYETAKHQIADDTPVTSPPAPPRQPPSTIPNFDFPKPDKIIHGPPLQQPTPMVFNGPVFFGYSPEQIRELLGPSLLQNQ